MQEVFSKGKWVKQKDKNGKVYMAWDDNAVDNTTWQKMPDLVKAICVDLSFNLGKQRMGKYKSFIKLQERKVTVLYLDIFSKYLRHILRSFMCMCVTVYSQKFILGMQVWRNFSSLTFMTYVNMKMIPSK